MVSILGALLVLAWAEWSKTPWRALGLAPPGNWTHTITIGVMAGVALKLLMKAIVLPLFGADPVNATYHYLVGNTAALPGILLMVIVGAGIGEEIIWRGFLFNRLRKIPQLGPSRDAAVVAISSVLFGLAHYADQGWTGVAQAVVTGAVFGSIYVATGRIWLSAVMHAAFNVTAVLIIYWDLELAVARFVL